MSFAATTPKNGKRIMGNREVTARGQTSVIQYTAMIKMAYAHLAFCKRNVQRTFDRNAV